MNQEQEQQQAKRPHWKPTAKQIKTWIQEGIDKDVDGFNGIVQCQQFGEHLAQGKNNRMSTNQVRKFFGALKKLQTQIHNNEDLQRYYHEVIMLKPQLAYAAGRNKGGKSEDFKEVISECIDSIERGNLQHFQNFVRFVEATVAYHKAAGGE